LDACNHRQVRDAFRFLVTDTMTPKTPLDHLDQGRLWPTPPGLSLDVAHTQALAVRQLRIARAERPRHKSTIWSCKL
jgi:hypothetical protein